MIKELRSLHTSSYNSLYIDNMRKRSRIEDGRSRVGLREV